MQSGRNRAFVCCNTGGRGALDAPRLTPLDGTRKSGGTTADLAAPAPALCHRGGGPFRSVSPTEQRPHWLKALPWLTPRRFPAPILSAPRSSRASPSCSRARTPPRRWRGHRAPARARRRAGRARRRPRGALDRVAARVLADAGPRAPAGRRGAQARRRHHALRAPGRRAVGHADRADRRGRRPPPSATAAERQRPAATVRGAALRRGRDRGRRGARPTTTSRSTGTPPRRPRRRRPSDAVPDDAGRQPAASGSSTPPAPARPSPRWASSRPRAPAAC